MTETELQTILREIISEFLKSPELDDAVAQLFAKLAPWIASECYWGAVTAEFARHDRIGLIEVATEAAARDWAGRGGTVWKQWRRPWELKRYDDVLGISG